MNSFEYVKNYAPGFSLVFNEIEEILKTEKTNYTLINSCVIKMANEYRSKINDQEVQTFLDLPATASHSIIRRSFLEEVILEGLSQALDSNSRINSFNVFVKKEILDKNGFHFVDINDIDLLGEKIKKIIPRIAYMSYFGKGPSGDQIVFSLFYDFQ